MKSLINFPEVTLLITHYNRSNSLERLLMGFEKINVKFADIVVSDDHSNEDHLKTLQTMQEKYNFRLITSDENKGLGNNLNKGQEAVSTNLTLYVQEDFEPTDLFRDALIDSVEFMKDDNELDLVRYFAYRQYPYTKPYKKGFSEIYVPTIGTNYKKIYAYSDHPHLRRTSFPCKFGKYIEGIKGDRTEYRMCISFIQKAGKAVIYDKYKSLFKHVNTETETSTMKRSKITQGNNLFLTLVRGSYRQVRYNYDIQFLKYKGMKLDPNSKICLENFD